MAKKSTVMQFTQSRAYGRGAVKSKDSNEAASELLRDARTGRFVTISETSKRVLKESAETHREALERLAKR